MKKCLKPDSYSLIHTEWLVTNGLGGFASGTISGIPTRKYHGLLVASLPAPFGRMMMLNYVADTLVLSNGEEICLSELFLKGEQHASPSVLSEFTLENGLPIWRYEVKDIVLEKTMFLVHFQNTLHVTYNLISSKNAVTIKWRPFLHFRRNDQTINYYDLKETYAVKSENHHYEIGSTEFPILRIYNTSPQSFLLDPKVQGDVFYKLEFERGYEYLEELNSPGYYSVPLCSGHKFTVIASTEPWNIIHALSPTEAFIADKIRRRKLLKQIGPASKSNFAAKLVEAADQFIFTPISRYEDIVRLRAGGGEARSIVAGYPWFTDWGRDTMISLEGLTMSTGRHREAYAILCTFAYYLKQGLIPNMFPEGQHEGVYYTADATLWFFHATDRYLQLTGDDDILEILLPRFREIINEHIKGTLYGIKVDDDGLLKQGDRYHPLTWMDAKLGDWIVTPRRGKAVEINALWYNALRLFETWTGEKLEITDKCYESFNKRFWYSTGNHLYDVVDGENGYDSALRPNQLFAISLRYPVLKEERWKPVLEAVQKNLLTPFGLRTLSPSHPDFKSQYNGDLRTRDASYHQGTVWPWLLGPFIDVFLKVYPDDLKTAAEFLRGLEMHMETNCFGTISEIFDALEPYSARGCYAQAWSIAEILRCLIKVSPDLQK
jgi:predicted glycogen debranching enzyme